MLPIDWAQRRWRLVGSRHLVACMCGDGGRRVTANTMWQVVPA